MVAYSEAASAKPKSLSQHAHGQQACGDSGPGGYRLDTSTVIQQRQGLDSSLHIFMRAGCRRGGGGGDGGVSCGNMTGCLGDEFGGGGLGELLEGDGVEEYAL